jgi:translation initiation factor 2 beta subunit (eIF-2beta)/eIF-5
MTCPCNKSKCKNCGCVKTMNMKDKNKILALCCARCGAILKDYRKKK